jgi:hypothetical protein
MDRIDMVEPSARRTHDRSVPFSLLLWFLAISIWFAWSPFELRTSPHASYDLIPSLNLRLLGHLLFLGPLAVGLGLAAEARNWSRPYLSAWAIATAAAFILELGQWGLDRRTLAPHDVMLGILGSALAIAATRKARDRGLRPKRLLAATWAATFVAVAASVSFGALFVERDFRLVDWDVEYPVLAGQEPDGSRSYRGEIRDARICAGPPPQRFCIEPGASESERRALVQMVLRTQEVSVSAFVRPESLELAGPARIVTFSDGTAARNVTVAQQGPDLVFRVRTPWTGSNGIHPQFVLPDAVPETTPRRVEAVFSDGTITMMAEGNGVRISGTHPNGSSPVVLEAQFDDEHRAPAYFVDRGALVGAGVLFAGVGIGLAWVARRARHLRWTAGPVAAALGLLTHDLLLLGRISAPHELLFAATAAFIGAALAIILDQRQGEGVWRAGPDRQAGPVN